jgi:hypothetical protein
MTTRQNLARVGATFALALTLVAATAPTFAFADEENNDDSEGHAPLVLNVVNDGIQTAAGATEGGLGIGEAASGVESLGTAAQGTSIGAAVTGAGLGIPAGVLGH